MTTSTDRFRLHEEPLSGRWQVQYWAVCDDRGNGVWADFGDSVPTKRMAEQKMAAALAVDNQPAAGAGLGDDALRKLVDRDVFDAKVASGVTVPGPFIEGGWSMFDRGAPDPDALVVALDAAKAWINGIGVFWPIGVPGPGTLTAANTEEEARVVFADQFARMAVEAYSRELARASSIEALLPKIDVARGGITYPAPSPGGWERPETPSAARRAFDSAVGAVRRARAARRRLADAGAVWRGEKQALTDAEVDALVEDY